MRLWAPSSSSPYQGPQQGMLHKVGKTLQTRSRLTRPRRSRGAGPSTPPPSGGSPSLSWSRRGRLLRGNLVSLCQTGRSKPDQIVEERAVQRGFFLFWYKLSSHFKVGFFCLKTNLHCSPSDTWSHHGQGWWLHWSHQSQCQHKGRAPSFCKAKISFNSIKDRHQALFKQYIQLCK